MNPVTWFSLVQLAKSSVNTLTGTVMCKPSNFKQHCRRFNMATSCSLQVVPVDISLVSLAGADLGEPRGPVPPSNLFTYMLLLL